MGYPYGKDFTYSFFPLVDNEALLVIPSQSPNIYLFTDSNVPSRDAAQNGTNAFQTITSWTQRGTGFEIAITAIEDPDPDSTENERTFWIAINFLLKAAGQVQTVIRALQMERVSGHHKQISVSPTDLIDYFPEAEAYVSRPQMIAFIAGAKEQIKSKLHMRGFEWSQIYRPDRLQQATILKSLMAIMLSQRRDVGDNFDRNYEEFKIDFTNAMTSLKIEYDSYKTGEPNPIDRKAGGSVFISR